MNQQTSGCLILQMSTQFFFSPLSNVTDSMFVIEHDTVLCFFVELELWCEVKGWELTKQIRAKLNGISLLAAGSSR